MNMPERYKDIVSKITAAALDLGVDVYIVGGFVRDIVMGREPKDLDIMVNSDKGGISFANELIKRYNYSGYTMFPRFGTAQLNMGGELVEFVMPREEFYFEDSRKPDTKFNGNIELDALRRDFAMNSLFLKVNNNTLLDLTGHGKSDIEDKIISITDKGNEDLIFTQDPLRMLRAIRFACQLDFSIDEAVIKSIIKNADKIKTISAERIREELNKILISSLPSKGINLLRELGLSKFILPEIETLDMEQPPEYHHKDVYQHTLMVLSNTKKDLILRWSALLHDIGKPVKRTIEEDKIHFYEHEKASADIALRILYRLKFSNEEIDAITFIVKNHMRPHTYEDNWTDSAVRRFIRDMDKYLPQIIDIVKADITSANPLKVQKFLGYVSNLENRISTLEEKAKSTEIKPLINGNELQSIFDKPAGRWIREIHEKLLEKQLENPMMTKEEAEVFVENLKKEVSNDI